MDRMPVTRQEEPRVYYNEGKDYYPNLLDYGHMTIMMRLWARTEGGWASAIGLLVFFFGCAIATFVYVTIAGG